MPALPPPWSPAKSECLTVDPNRDTRFIEGGESIGRFRLRILLNQLVQLYIFGADRTRLNLIAVNGLPADKAVMSAQNFVYYVASKLDDHLFPLFCWYYLSILFGGCCDTSSVFGLL